MINADSTDNDKDASSMVDSKNVAPELEDIQYEEKYHITAKKSGFVLLNFTILFVTKFFYDLKDEESPWYIGELGKNLLLASFIATMF